MSHTQFSYIRLSYPALHGGLDRASIILLTPNTSQNALSKAWIYFPLPINLECCWVSISPTFFASGEPWSRD